MESDFLALMTSRVRISRLVGRNQYGEPEYGPEQDYPARVVGKLRMVRTLTGEEKVSDLTVYIPAADVTPSDRLTLADGSSPRIMAVAQYPDEGGTHHTVIYAGRA